MRVLSLVVADAVVVGPDGKMSIFGAGVDLITASQFPWAQAQLSVFISLRGEGEDDGVGTEHDLRVRVRAADDALLAELGGPFTVTSALPEADLREAVQNAAIVFQQLQFPAAGTYGVDVVVDGVLRESAPLKVVRGAPTQGQWTTAPAALPM